MKIKTVLILLSVSLVFCLSLQSQTNTNPSSSAKLTPADRAELISRGYDPDTFVPDNQGQKPQQPNLSPTPSDLKKAVVCMDSFLGMTNAMLPADVISMKPESLKFRINGQDYNYSGHYTVMLNTPRQHKNPYFGFGTPETAKVLILENWNGDMLPLQNAIMWEKSSGFIDAVALGKEWIYSGTYTIQN